MRELRGFSRAQIERAVGSGDRDEPSGRDVEALQRSAFEAIDYVHDALAHGDADRERTARADHLAQCELVAEHREHRDRVAPRVDGVEQAVLAVVGERALRREVIHHRAFQLASEPAGGVNPGLRERTFAGAVVDDDLVASEVVGLDEHGMRGSGGECGRADDTERARGENRRHAEAGCCSHCRSPRSWGVDMQRSVRPARDALHPRLRSHARTLKRRARATPVGEYRRVCE